MYIVGEGDENQGIKEEPTQSVMLGDDDALITKSSDKAVEPPDDPNSGIGPLYTLTRNTDYFDVVEVKAKWEKEIFRSYRDW